jgi:hypothetical protein
MLLSSKWVKPSLKEEWAEILLTATQFDMDSEFLKQAYQDGQMVSLDDSIWSILENTDSWEIKQGDWKTVQELATKYNEENRAQDPKGFGKGRDPSHIKKGLEEGAPMPAPMVLSVDGIYYLIGGNTRLMVSKAMGIRPKVFLLTIGE